MHMITIAGHYAGKPYNCLLVRPTKVMLDLEFSAMKSIEGFEIVGWRYSDKTGICDSKNSGACLPEDSREFDCIDVSFRNRY